MNHKIILFTLWLLPIVMHTHPVQKNASRIKEIEATRFEKETEIAKLSRQILEEADAL